MAASGEEKARTTKKYPAGAQVALPLADIILDTVREPLVGLDDDLNILFASGSFDRSFQMAPGSATGRQFFALDNCTWDIPGLRAFLKQPTPQEPDQDGFEITREFPRIGRRTLVLHARRPIHAVNPGATILLSFDDITARRVVEDQKETLKTHADELLKQKEILLEEMQHRVLNSLQIIASILMLKARAVKSEEARQHLQDAHQRVMSIAVVQQHLHFAERDELIEMAPYLKKLCCSLAKSMLGEDRMHVLRTEVESGQMPSADAVSLGLIVTEMIINALKHAFPEQKDSAAVTVRYEMSGTDWKLSISDNGVGRRDAGETPAKRGLGTSLVSALAHQLDARVMETSGPDGLTVTVEHVTNAACAEQAA